MIISFEKKVIYFGLPRTASSSITLAMMQNYDARLIYKPEWDLGGFTTYKTFHGKAQHQIVLPAEYQDFFTFTCVRDPVTRFQSLYGFFGKDYWGMNNFNDMLDTPPPTMKQLLFGGLVPEGCVPVRIDQVIKFENLDAEFNALPFVGGSKVDPFSSAQKDVRLARVHESKESKPALGIPHRTLINTHYAEDFAEWSYPLLDPQTGLRLPLLSPGS